MLNPLDADSTSPPSPTTQPTPAAPQATLHSGSELTASRLRTRLWWLTGLCVLLAIGLVASSLRSQGKRITIHFLDGYGLKTGDTLRYRGIDVGSVSNVQLDGDLQGVEVSVQLLPGNEHVAVEGSQFWIQRARLRLGQVTGLDTVLGAKYVGVVPGESGKPLVGHFVGQETPLGFTDGQSLEIRVLFPAGEGLEEGDPVRYRGISVGEVTSVELASNGDAVAVGVRLVGASRELARLGTQFWIERPRLDLTEVRGLETLIGGRYIAMQPTSWGSPAVPPLSGEFHSPTHAEQVPRYERPEGNPFSGEFQGLAEPPPLPRRDGSLEIELDASRRLGIVRGAPVTYRGLEVGRVSQVGLASDGASVKTSITIEPEYAELVRDNSKWWAMGGIQFDAGLSGVQVSVESLSAWVRGGIAFATPPTPGDHVVTGHRFMLEGEPQAEWLQWQPRIAMRGPHNSPSGLALPSPVRVVASWQASWLGLYRRRTLETWSIALSDDRLCVPADFIRRAQQAGNDVTIEVAGQSVALSDTPLSAAPLADAQLLVSLPLPSDAQVANWPSADIAADWSNETVLLVVNPELREPLAIDGTRLSNSGTNAIGIAPGVAIAPALSGSPVVNAASGKLVGLLLLEHGQWTIGTF